MRRKLPIAAISPKLFQVFREGYNKQDLIKDIIAGVTVGVVALPLALAFAIASGVTPEKGLITAIVAGFFISLVSGSKFQIGGPTVVFAAVVSGVLGSHGAPGLMLAIVMAGIILIFFGISKLGMYVKFIPYPVTAGFMAGLGLILMTTEFKDLFGFPIKDLAPTFIGRMGQYINNIGLINPYALFIGVLTLILTLIIRKKQKKIPGHIFAIITSTIIVAIFSLNVETIESRFGGIPSSLPMPVLPAVSFDLIRDLLPAAFALALLAAIESLLTCVVTDGMTGERSDPNTELVAQGVGNIFAALFGGLPATGAMARTVTNVKLGARTPIAGIIHALVLFLIMLGLSKLVAKIPMAAIAGILMVVAWDMMGVKALIQLRKAPISDFLVMLTSFILTLVVGINLAVQVGVVMAALLFMKRMSDVTNLETLVDDTTSKGTKYDPDSIVNKVVPDGVGVYEINGPLFFGIADKMIRTLESISNMPKVFILRMRRVPTIDATGLNALHKFYETCSKRGVALILSGIKSHQQPKQVMERDGFLSIIGRENVLKNIDLALERAAEVIQEMNENSSKDEGSKK